MSNVDKRIADIKQQIVSADTKIVSSMALRLDKTEAEVAKNFTEDYEVVTKNIEEKLPHLLQIKHKLEVKDGLARELATLIASSGFLKIEEDVLANKLAPAESERLKRMIKLFRYNRGPLPNVVYEDIIIKIYKSEIVIEGNSIKFKYAKREINRGESIKVTQGSLFNKDNKDNNYKLIKDREAELGRNAKFIATQANTFDAILAGFPGDQEQKNIGLALVLGIDGKIFLDMENFSSDGISYLDMIPSRYSTRICNNDDRDTEGYIIFAKEIV